MITSEQNKQSNKQIKRIKKPKCKMVGMNGNVFNLIGIASAALKKANLPEQSAGLNEFLNAKAMMKLWLSYVSM